MWREGRDMEGRCLQAEQSLPPSFPASKGCLSIIHPPSGELPHPNKNVTRNAQIHPQYPAPGVPRCSGSSAALCTPGLPPRFPPSWGTDSLTFQLPTGRCLRYPGYLGAGHLISLHLKFLFGSAASQRLCCLFPSLSFLFKAWDEPPTQPNSALQTQQ